MNRQHLLSCRLPSGCNRAATLGTYPGDLGRQFCRHYRRQFCRHYRRQSCRHYRRQFRCQGCNRFRRRGGFRSCSFLKQEPAQRTKIIEDAAAVADVQLQLLQTVGCDSQCVQAARRFCTRFSLDVSFKFALGLSDSVRQKPEKIVGAFYAVERLFSCRSISVLRRFSLRGVGRMTSRIRALSKYASTHREQSVMWRTRNRDIREKARGHSGII